MAERKSTGLVNYENVTGSKKSAWTNCVMYLYGGSGIVQPATADATETGTLLAIVTVDGAAYNATTGENGLNFDVSTDGVLAKAASEDWKFTGLAAAGTGTVATYFRLYGNADPIVTGASTTAIRMDGAVGQSSSYELNLSNATIAENAPGTIDTFTITNPKQ